MSKAFEKIMAGLDDARDWLDGERKGFVAHRVEIREPDAKAIRDATGLSRPDFARRIGVALDTLEEWEQGRARPEGPARVLLALIERRPSLARDELAR